ncbi:MAG: hypothetical protein Q8L14_17775 [Myxococcales bacterium]|nr:hypothetical protein [Myxococcales bacterium]
MSTIEEELRLLAAAAKPLQQATDEANAAIQAANAGIAANAPGIEIWLRDREGRRLLLSNSDGGYGDCLGIDKVKNAWQVVGRACHVTMVGDDIGAGDFVGESYPLAEASRETRLEAAALLPELIRALTRECHRLLQISQRAAEKVP